MLQQYGLLVILLTLLSHSSWGLAWSCCAQQGGVCGQVCCDQITLLSDAAAKCGQVVLLESDESVELEALAAIDPAAATAAPLLLYHWQAANGQQHYSAVPPHWYRDPNYPNHYPRIRVYDQNHALVDDTAVILNRNVTRSLRQRAYSLAEYYQQMREQKAQAEQAMQRLRQQRAELQALIAQNQIALNMTPEQVNMSWGPYQAQKIESTPEGNQVTWFYDEDEQQWVSFLNGYVVDFRIVQETTN